ncbi:hypothetical protein ILYODFUR_021168 [Ilyodon furcidens]|uniref:Uncharacterized protein n=1 Tax=Ilyodon furcidens TaxID=33524 RepID=A0ABV0V4W9_9TELE
MLTHSALQNCFKTQWGVSRMTGLVKVKLQQSPDFDLFLSHLEMDLLVFFGSLFCWVTEVSFIILDFILQEFLLENRIHQTSWFYPSQQVIQMLKSHIITLPPLCFTVGMMFCFCNAGYFNSRYNTTITSQTCPLLSHQSTEYFLRTLEDHQDVFWENVRRAFVSFWVSSGSCLGTFPWRPFFPSLSFLLLNHDL